MNIILSEVFIRNMFWGFKFTRQGPILIDYETVKRMCPHMMIVKCLIILGIDLLALS